MDMSRFSLYHNYCCLKTTTKFKVISVSIAQPKQRCMNFVNYELINKDTGNIINISLSPTHICVVKYCNQEVLHVFCNTIIT